MTQKIPSTRTLATRPDFDQLRRQAKELLEAYVSGEGDAVAEVNAHYRHADAATFALHEAQLVLARAYGFDSWPKLKAYVNGVTAGRLCDAVERGDLAAVADILRQRPELVDVDRPDHGEERALHGAVLRRDPEMVRLLMDHGADARQGIWPNRDATSALTLALERGDDHIVRIIEREEQRRREALRPDSGSDAARPGTLNSLFEAIAEGDDRSSIALLQAEPALIHECDQDGWTALHRAAASLNPTLVRWLVNGGADVNRRGKDGWTPLDVAASGRGWPQAAGPQRFTAVAGLLRQHGAELTPCSAVALGDSDWLCARHAGGLLVNATVLEVFEPFGGLLTTAVRHDRPEMVALLLDFGFDPDERVRVAGTEEVVHSSGTPLYECAQAGKHAIAAMLLERGADPNAQVCASGSPTFAAYGRTGRRMIELLERHGGTLAAAEVGYVRQTELARRMLDGKVDPQLHHGTFSGRTVAEQLLWSGASGGDPEIVRMALERIDWPPDDSRWFRMLWRPLPGHSPRSARERRNFLACFRLVLERCDANVRSERQGQTMLHELAARDLGEGVAFATVLLDAGARLDVRDTLLQSTPLGWACRWGRIDLVRLLLHRGADPVEAGAEPWATPTAWAQKKGHDAVLTLLHGRGDVPL